VLCLCSPVTVWPLFKWNIDYIILGYLARETQVPLTQTPKPKPLTPNPNP